VASHAWVQVQEGNAWVDLDTTLTDAQMGKALAAASGTAGDVPPEQQHTVVVRVIAETLAGGKMSETVSLERELPAAGAARQYLVLAFAGSVGQAGGLLSGGSPPGSFVPMLWIADHAESGQPIATSAGGGGAGFDALFGGEAPSNELSALFIEIETRVPGRGPTKARHVLLDRVPAGARSGSRVSAARLKPLSAFKGVPRAVRGWHHVLISTGGTSALDMARLRLAGVQGAVASTEPASPPGQMEEGVSPVWVCDLMLVEGSEQVVVAAMDAAAGRTYVDQPRVFLGSWVPGDREEELSRETDLLIDSVRVLLPEPAPAREISGRQLQYGALQSALETETGLRFAAAWNPAGRSIVSTSLATGGSLSVLAPADADRLPERSAASLRRALRAGDLAVVPGDVATAQAWWTVGPSGFARAIIEPGTGGLKIVGEAALRVVRKAPASGAGNNSGGGGSGQYAGMVKTQGQAAKEGGQVISGGVRHTAKRAADLFETGPSRAINWQNFLGPK
jgi:hypothetical protein